MNKYYQDISYVLKYYSKIPFRCIIKVPGFMYVGLDIDEYLYPISESALAHHVDYPILDALLFLFSGKLPFGEGMSI